MYNFYTVYCVLMSMYTYTLYGSLCEVYIYIYTVKLRLQSQINNRMKTITTVVHIHNAICIIQGKLTIDPNLHSTGS